MMIGAGRTYLTCGAVAVAAEVAGAETVVCGDFFGSDGGFFASWALSEASNLSSRAVRVAINLLDASCDADSEMNCARERHRCDHGVAGQQDGEDKCVLAGHLVLLRAN